MDTHTFTNPRPLAWAVCALAIVYGLLVVGNFASNLHVGILLSRIADDEPGARYALAQQAHSLVTTENILLTVIKVVFWLNTLLFLCWLYRVAANLRALGARTLEYTPGWAVGWFFIPFANLIKPYFAVQEIWITSHDPSQRRITTSHAPVLAWWLLRMATMVVVLIVKAMKLAEPRPSLQSLIHRDMLLLGNSLLDLATAALFAYVVWRISQLQASHMRPEPILELADDAEPPTLPA